MVHFDQIHAPTPVTELPYSCDLVMKGGLTSGVVYSSAIAELAQDHRFHKIGGSSAGAIAAVLAAAAEYGRHTTHPDAFKELAEIPNVLAEEVDGQTLLRRLFVPQESTAPYFNLLWSMRAASKSDKPGALKFLIPIMRSLGVRPTLLSWPLALIVGGIAVGLFGPASFWVGLASAVLATLGIVCMLIEGLTQGARRFARDAMLAIKANNHGLIDGTGVPSVGNDREPIGLTPWLHEQIQRLAGRGVDDRPVTYGDLQGKGIDLVTLTTNLTQGTSETFPFADDTWAFDRHDLEELFPTNVVKQLVNKDMYTGDGGLYAFPPVAEIPILLGARLSLSFPVLLSAVPVYRDVGQPDDDAGRRPKQIWLSDGGICSNLPVHLFDSALPARPTYGINLATGATTFDQAMVESDWPAASGETIEEVYAARNVYRPMGGNHDLQPPATNIDNTIDLLRTMFDTMMNWTDNSTAQAIGVRDRICTIRLRKEEGSMNLDMPGQTIADLTFRGTAAGKNLGSMVRENQPAQLRNMPLQDDGAATQWERHRWARFRTLLGSLADFSTDVSDRYTAEPDQHGPVPTSDTMATRANTTQLVSYEQLCENEGRVRDTLDPQGLSGDWSTELARAAKRIMDGLPELPFDVLQSADTEQAARQLILSARPPRHEVPPNVVETNDGASDRT